MKTKSNIRGLGGFLRLWSTQTVSELGTAMTDYALVIWVYGQAGTASSVALLTICAFLPTIFFRFIAGALVDRWDKKRVMLAADLATACGTATVLILYTLSALRTWHIYLINVLLSLMNAFQVPASFVATTLLTPKEHYHRVGGLQGFSGAAVSILAPALGSALMAFGGMKLVLVVDLMSFFVAFLTLLCCIHIPEAPRRAGEAREPFTRDVMAGVRYLREHRAILRVTLFLAAVNFLAKLGNDGMLAPFVLGRTGNVQRVLGMVESAVAVGLMAGGLIVAFTKPPRRRTRLIFIACAVVFSANVVQGLTHGPLPWCAAAFFGYMMAAVMNANLTTILREKVPPEAQGRVFSAKDTLQIARYRWACSWAARWPTACSSRSWRRIRRSKGRCPGSSARAADWASR